MLIMYPNLVDANIKYLTQKLKGTSPSVNAPS